MMEGYGFVQANHYSSPPTSLLLSYSLTLSLSLSLSLCLPLSLPYTHTLSLSLLFTNVQTIVKLKPTDLGLEMHNSGLEGKQNK